MNKTSAGKSNILPLYCVSLFTAFSTGQKKVGHSESFYRFFNRAKKGRTYFKIQGTYFKISQTYFFFSQR